MKSQFANKFLIFFAFFEALVLSPFFMWIRNVWIKSGLQGRGVLGGHLCWDFEETPWVSRDPKRLKTFKVSQKPCKLWETLEFLRNCKRLSNLLGLLQIRKTLEVPRDPASFKGFDSFKRPCNLLETLQASKVLSQTSKNWKFLSLLRNPCKLTNKTNPQIHKPTIHPSKTPPIENLW